MPVFPAFGAPVGASFQEAPPNNLLRSQMDVGPAKTRRRTTANVRVIGMTYMLNSDQMVTLDSFYENDCEDGALSFSYTHPRTLATVTARFASAPQYSWSEGIWAAQLQLEILPS